MRGTIAGLLFMLGLAGAAHAASSVALASRAPQAAPATGIQLAQYDEHFRRHSYTSRHHHRHHYQHSHHYNYDR